MKVRLRLVRPHDIKRHNANGRQLEHIASTLPKPQNNPRTNHNTRPTNNGTGQTPTPSCQYQSHPNFPNPWCKLIHCICPSPPISALMAYSAEHHMSRSFDHRAAEHCRAARTGRAHSQTGLTPLEGRQGRQGGTHRVHCRVDCRQQLERGTQHVTG